MDLRAGRFRGGGPRGFYESLDELIEAAKHQARLREPADKDGKTTRREVLEGLVRTGRRHASVLEGPEVSRSVAYLWGWYMELARVAQVTQAGVQPIGYAEIDAWARLTGRNPMPHEVEALVQIDMALRVPGKEGE